MQVGVGGKAECPNAAAEEGGAESGVKAGDVHGCWTWARSAVAIRSHRLRKELDLCKGLVTSVALGPPRRPAC